MNHIYYIVFFFLLASNSSFGQQNLILNGDFEEYWECPDDATQIERCKNVFNPLPFDDLMSFSSTSDYYNQCFVTGSGGALVGVPNNMEGHQNTFSGKGMIGFLSYDNFTIDYHHREYIQLSFSEELKCGMKYCFTSYFNLSDYMRFTLKSLGFYFSEEELNEQDYLYNLYQPQYLDVITEISDTAKWTKLTFEFVADQPYKFVSIGNTKISDSSFYFEINPDALEKSFLTYYYVDSASLIEIGQTNIVFPNVFTPNGDGINDIFQPIGEASHLKELLIINRWGNVISNLSYPFHWDGTNQGQQISEGVYYYLVIPNDGCVLENLEQQHGMVHLIR